MPRRCRHLPHLGARDISVRNAGCNPRGIHPVSAGSPLDPMGCQDARMCLEVAGENLPQVLPTVDDFSLQMV
jgi:hypothetical protein